MVGVWEGGNHSSLGCGGPSAWMGEAGAAPCLREKQGSANPAPCHCLLPLLLLCRLYQVGDRPAPGGLRGGWQLFGGQEQVGPWPQHRASETLSVP